MKRALFGLVFLVCATASLAEAPPALLTYQGFLRNAAGQPLNGAYDLVFRLFSADVGGDEIVVSTQNGVQVSEGIFTATLGGTNVADGSGPGVYGTLVRALGDYGTTYLEVSVNGEVLGPRTALSSAPYALNARLVNGVDVVSVGALDLYVNGDTGDDQKSGRFAGSAKKTIQAALNAIPAVTTGPVTVHIAQSASAYAGGLVLADRQLHSWQPITLRGEPSATISGSGLDTGLLAMRISNLVLDHLTFTGFSGQALLLAATYATLKSCELANSNYGVEVTWGSQAIVQNCNIHDNQAAGIGELGSWVEIVETPEAPGLGPTILKDNGHGLRAQNGGRIVVNGPLQVSGNGRAAVYATQGAMVDLWSRSDVSLADPGSDGCLMVSKTNATVQGYGSAVTSGPPGYCLCQATYNGICADGRP
ncbi:MAG: hypothetical protein HZB55_17140 [Deltaproteobacteria bacterium]|nr:hypothetical protein [Deltaproteobacteria bacterium]